ncbi:alpha/beta fold hydrolase [Archangium violaceum]|uniref:alpha/beta fold hydrolase n=1 Tax=Archangium violaceum TaxID=83451 RepID=UPI00193BB16F|nr:alpha/beta hydrolase [Archangium violaceum]QRK07319.1 alpha/beta fold hydrolase [Archangium violaceum]
MEFGSGRPVILLHGISNSGRAWGPQIVPLADAGFRVIVPDHAGHGASGPVNRPWGIQDFTADVVALLAHLDIGNADVVGLSLGGMVALQLALERPELVGRLVVANSFDTTATPGFRSMAEGWAGMFRSEEGPVRRLERTWPMLVNDAFRASGEGRRTYQVWHGIAATAHGPSLAYVSEGIIGFDVTTRLASLKRETLFIAGEKDAMSPPEVSRRMAETVPHARYAELAEAFHISNVDAAEHFNRLLIPFLLD